MASKSKISANQKASSGSTLPHLVRQGFGVELTRDDGTTFLALTGGGILPFVHVYRKHAVEYKRQMREWGFKARVVPVTFSDPMTNSVLSNSSATSTTRHPELTKP